MENLKSLEFILDFIESADINAMDDLKPGERQILIVHRHFIYTQNVRPSDTQPEPYSKTVVMLEGIPTASSDQNFKQAIIRFEKDDKDLRPPKFLRNRGQLHLWFHYRHLDAFVSQIHEPKVYCWAGKFQNGHVYGDVHTASQ